MAVAQLTRLVAMNTEGWPIAVRVGCAPTLPSGRLVLEPVRWWVPTAPSTALMQSQSVSPLTRWY